MTTKAVQIKNDQADDKKRQHNNKNVSLCPNNISPAKETI
jgi:hypothetical protein